MSPHALPQRGFTLLELLVVVAIMAIATAGVSLSLRDGASTRLEREGERLAALLEAARAQSRASGVPVRWSLQGNGFRFEGLPPEQLPSAWLDSATTAQTAPGQGELLLGPEPLIPPQQVLLSLADQPERRLQVATDGLHPFTVEAAP